jgi:hypothetical protein
MKGLDTLRTPLGVDALSVAGAFGAISGVASLGVPYFDGLAEALAALAAVAWVARVGNSTERRLSTTGPVAAATAGAWSFALLAPMPFAALRGALLGACAAGLAWQARHLAPAPEGGA